MIECLLWAVPAYLVNPLAVLSGLFFRKKHPLDFGKKFFDGERVFGNGKTWEGSIFAFFTSFILSYPLFTFFSLKYDILLICFGALFGDIVGSFIKRRAGLPRGSEAPVLDQLDFLFGAYLFTPISPSCFLFLLFITPLVHRAANILAYRIGLKKEPW